MLFSSFLLKESQFISSNSFPDTINFSISVSYLFTIPISSAMANAVNFWSPVIITTLIPEVLHWLTASLTSFLGGSIMPTSPRNKKSLLLLFVFLSGRIWPIWTSLLVVASARTLSPSLAILWFTKMIWSLILSVKVKNWPSFRTLLQWFKMTRGAPLAKISYSFFLSDLWKVVIIFLSAVKGISLNLGDKLDNSSFTMPTFFAKINNAISVVSPNISIISSWSNSIFASLHRRAHLTSNIRSFLLMLELDSRLPLVLYPTPVTSMKWLS